MHIRADAEIPSNEQAFTFGDLPLVTVVGHAVLQPPIVGGDGARVPRQVEVKEMSSLEKRTRGGDKQIALELRAKPASGDKPMPPGATSNFQENPGSL